ncbi:MAG: ATPase [Neptuniibacter caesariensis]|uniref:ATPase n=1 Tax=Neptuniibacter caesariensis TaxID=207954 RepID=A0A2G6JQ42_NEPCE|nr:MAG: ATPase [Neptuniibacter caesariensis]
MQEPEVDELIDLFARLFKETEKTILVKGEDEPIYLPADQDNPYHRVIFAHGFYASALHEIAHWCVAGPQRRQLEDFGYWYKPDGRSADEQAEFEKVEVRPQAFEWLMSKAAGHKFNFSADNLAANMGASDSFKAQVLATVHDLLDQGLPERVAMLVDALCQQSGRGPLHKSEFQL